MISLLYKFVQACYKSGPHLKYVLKIVHRPPDSHDKIIYMNFFVIPTSVTKFESCCTW